MNNLLIIQLLISFLVGGGIVTLLTFIAERVNAKIAGIILVFPSTIAISFFFLGWAFSAQTVAEIIPSTLIPLGLTILFPAFYIYTANFLKEFIKNELIQIILSFIFSISIWFALSIPLIIYKVNNLFIGIIVFTILALFSYYLLHIKIFEKSPAPKYSLGQKISRAAFVGVIIVLVVFLAKTLNPFWGGMFAMFPAAFSSSLVIFHWYYKPENLFPLMQNVSIGSINIFAYTITAMLVFPSVGFIWGTLIAYLVSIFTMLVLTKFRI